MNGLAAIEAVEGRPRRAIEIAAAAENFAEQEGVVIEFGINNHGKIYLDIAEKDISQAERDDAIKIGRQHSLNEVLEMVNNDVIQISQASSDNNG